MKRAVVGIIAGAALCTAFVVQQAGAQQLGVKPWRQVENPWLGRVQQEAYLNYGEEAYKSYKRELDIDKRYDFLGNFLMEGYLMYRQNEARPGRIFVRQDEPIEGAGSYQEKHDFFAAWFNELMISSDNFRGWSARLTVGDNIRTKYSSLTVNLTRLTGVRFDLASRRHKMTITQWRGTNEFTDVSEEKFSIPLELRANAAEPEWRFEISPLQNIGGHWESTFGAGDAIRLGGTFVNQHLENISLGSRRNPLRGTLPTADMLPPGVLVVRFEDDSPEDGSGGAAVFEEQFILRVDYKAIPGGLAKRDTTVVLRAVDVTGFDAQGNEVTIPGAARVEQGNVIFADGARQVQGENSYVEYRFPIDNTVGNVDRARWEAVVANDYRVSISQVHNFFDTSKDDFVERFTDPYVVDRAPGNIKDFSNKSKIRFDYGFTTGQTILGWDWELNLIGLKVRGEFNNNWVFAQYPTLKGSELTFRRTSAWYVNVLKQVAFLTTGFEYFHVAPGYGGGYNGRGRDLKQHRAGVTLYSDKGGIEEDPNDRNKRITKMFPLIDDNDDLDQWPDDNENDFFGRINQDAGVFPDQDEDKDGVPDDDRDGDGVVDWQEPFLLYYSDPLPFVYGDDFNNNGVIDVRENDEKPDFAYDRDLEGPHWFVAGVPVDNMELTLGLIRQRELARGGENEMAYLKGTYLYDIPRIVELDVKHDTKRVRDNIPNHVYDINEQPNPEGPGPDDPLYDRLDRRNSLVSTNWLGTRVKRFDNLNIVNNFKWTRNHQLPDIFRDPFLGIGEQVDAVVTEVTTSHRVDYTWSLGNVVILPQLKVLWRRKSTNPKAGFGVDEKLIEEVRVAPILRVDYHITPRTTIRLGQQGFRLGFADDAGTRNALAFKFKDKVKDENDFSRTDSLIQFSNVSDYWGYKIAANVGFHRVRVEFDDPAVNAVRQEAFSRFFVEIVTGY